MKELDKRLDYLKYRLTHLTYIDSLSLKLVELESIREGLLKLNQEIHMYYGVEEKILTKLALASTIYENASLGVTGMIDKLGREWKTKQ